MTERTGEPTPLAAARPAAPTPPVRMTSARTSARTAALASASTRRNVLIGAGVVGMVGTAGLLAGCSGDPVTVPSGSTSPAGGSSTPTPTPTDEAMRASAVPVGGGVVFPRHNVVVTQPTAGTFKAFDATCRHMGCQVTTVEEGKINCFCHRSQFNIADGSVARGPATTPLPAKQITVTGDTIVVS